MASRPPEQIPPGTPDPAMGRFYVLSALRFTGAALVILGLMTINHVVDLPEAFGWVFIPLGLAEFFVLPKVLARRWRTPPA